MLRYLLFRLRAIPIHVYVLMSVVPRLANTCLKPLKSSQFLITQTKHQTAQLESFHTGTASDVQHIGLTNCQLKIIFDVKN